MGFNELLQIVDGWPVFERPTTYHTPFGQFDYRHNKVDWFRGYQQTDLGNVQSAFVASPEKTLLDFVYLQPDGETEDFLRSLLPETMGKAVEPHTLGLR